MGRSWRGCCSANLQRDECWPYPSAMPPRTGHQLDEISQAIGELKGAVRSIDKYIHEREHGIASLAMKVDGLSAQITREVSRMKAEIQVQLEAISARVTKLEDSAAQMRGARGLAVWFVNSPMIGWIVAAAALLWRWKGQGR